MIKVVHRTESYALCAACYQYIKIVPKPGVRRAVRVPKYYRLVAHNSPDRIGAPPCNGAEWVKGSIRERIEEFGSF